MSGIWVRAGALGTMIAAMLLAACGDAPDESEQGATPTPTVRATRTDGLPPEMVAAVAAGKTASAISVHFSLGSVPTPNHVLSVNIAIVPHQEFASVRANFESRDGITLVSGDKIQPIQKLKPEQMISHELVVMPTAEGVQLITASVETDSAEGVITRVFSIPVIVTPPAPAPAPEPAPAADAAAPSSAPGPAAN